MPDTPTRRDRLKRESRLRILDAAAARLRDDGLDGAPIAPVMAAAGLTHGAFYAHFDSKDDLAVAAFRHAITENRRRWIGTTRDASWAARVARLARGYLNRTHRDRRAESCPYAALAADIARSSPAFRAAFERELRGSLDAMGDTPAAPGGEHARYDETIALMALFVGGLSLARAVESPAFSDRILKVCRQAAAQLGTKA